MNYYEDFTKHLLEDERPSEYFNKLVERGKYPEEYPYDIILKLKNIEQNPKYHPEGDVWNHTMQVIDEAAKRKNMSVNPGAFMWSAFFHDIGKISTTKVRRGRITSYDHDKVGGEMVKEILIRWGIKPEEEFYKYVYSLVRLHMQILHIVKDNEFADYKLVLESGYYKDIALLGLCDRLGRGSKTEEEIKKEENNIQVFIEKCEKHLSKK